MVSVAAEAACRGEAGPGRIPALLQAAAQEEPDLSVPVGGRGGACAHAPASACAYVCTHVGTHVCARVCMCVWHCPGFKALPARPLGYSYFMPRFGLSNSSYTLHDGFVLKPRILGLGCWALGGGIMERGVCGAGGKTWRETDIIFFFIAKTHRVFERFLYLCNDPLLPHQGRLQPPKGNYFIIKKIYSWYILNFISPELE